MLSVSAEQIYSTSSLSAGMHVITLVVVDDEGISSDPAHVMVYVADEVFHTNRPMVRK